MEPMIRTQKANCRNCYRCIRVCPVKAVAFSQDQARVVEEDCILCGLCVEACPQGAQQFASDLPAVRRMADAGLKLYASVAPSYPAAFPGVSFSQLSAALKALGFTGVEETALGAAQVSRQYARLMGEGKMENIISTCCPALVLLVEKYYPELTDQLAPVLSPAAAHGKMLKTMFGSRVKTVFIGPCAAKRQEAREGNSLNGVLLFEELRQWMGEKGVSFGPEDPYPTELHDVIHRLYPSPGGIIATIPPEKRKGYKTYATDGVERCMETLEALRQGQIKGYFLELSACQGSCIRGPGIDSGALAAVTVKERLLAAARRKTRTPAPLTEGAAADFRAQYRPQRRKNPQPTQRQIAQILAQTGKLTPADLLNCGACGYPTCRDKAIAVFQGRADVKMCLPYMRERAESTSNLIIEYAPSAILLLSPQQEILEYNKQAMELLGIRGRAGRGRPVSDYLEGGLPPLEQGGPAEAPGKAAVDGKQLRLSAVRAPGGDIILLLRDVTRQEERRSAAEKLQAESLRAAQQAADRQIRMAQRVAALLGESAGETKAALLRLEAGLKGRQEEKGED